MISTSIQTVQKKHFLWNMYFHSFISIRGCALFSLWNSPNHGRHKTVETKGSNVRYNKINITFPDMVIVENIIPRNVIINLGCASVDNHIPRDDIFDYHHIREGNIYIMSTLYKCVEWSSTGYKDCCYKSKLSKNNNTPTIVRMYAIC